MEHFHSFEEAGNNQSLQGAWATIGTFDGVHRGHQAILKPLVSSAHAAGAPAIVVTFHPHPTVVLRGAEENLYLTSPAERAQLLGGLGIDGVVTLTFDQALAALGRNRQGNIPTLAQLGEALGYRMHVTAEVDEVDDGNQRISSSLIRELLRQGQTTRAARLLGRPYAVEGAVVHGDGRGRKLGFPTANIDYWPGKLVPLGIYATWTWIGERRVASVTSVGVRPTFDHPPANPMVEAYLLDFDEDLYDQIVRVDFLAFLRPELRFDSVQSLINQMALDTLKAREVLSNAV
jgi:riboflavin kinase / FMN adenylyltransferase